MEIINELIRLDKLNKELDRLERNDYTSDELNRMKSIQKQVAQTIDLNRVMMTVAQILEN